MATTIRVGADFSKFPGVRYRRDGKFSGEEFRDDILAPALLKAISDNTVLHVVLDDVAGYGSSFLDEAFAGLLRPPHKFTSRDLQEHLRIVALTPRFQHHAVRARTYINEQAARNS